MFFDIWATKTKLCGLSQLFAKCQMSSGPYGSIYLLLSQAVGTKYTMDTWCLHDNLLSIINHFDIKYLHLPTFAQHPLIS